MIDEDASDDDFEKVQLSQGLEKVEDEPKP